MRIIYSTLYLIIVISICASLVNAQGLSQRPAVTKMLIIADNQEHLLTGGSLRSFSPLSERLITSVGLRSPLANVGGRLLMREALKFGRERGAGLVLHLGDATDISCESELTSVFEALNEETSNKMWFMTPGNHDGLLAGNFAAYQDPPCFVRERPSFYDGPPLNGYGVEKNIWYYACQSPNSLGADMPRGRAIELYIEQLKQREHVQPQKEPEKEILTFNGEHGSTHVPCRLEEIEITPPPSSSIVNYKAVARICDPQPVDGRMTMVGQYASFIVQMIDVVGARIVLLDTSDYDNPTEKTKLFFPVVLFRGEVTDCQRKRAESFFYDDDKPIDRRNVIVAGHHPFSQLPKDDQKWIAEKSARYVSAHVHTSTSLIEHKDSRMLELNIGSTLDYPPQAVFAEINSHSMSVRVAGAETNWDAFLSRCISERCKWMLPEKSYMNYRSGLYVDHLLKALGEAAAKHDALLGRSSLPLEIPTGREKGDWERLGQTLEDIDEAVGDSRLFWACQAYYASRETRREKGFFAERIAPKLGLGFKRGRNIPSGWASFSSP